MSAEIGHSAGNDHGSPHTCGMQMSRKKKHMHSVSRKSDKSHFMNITEEVIASEIFEETNIYEDGNDVEEEPDDIIIVHMDIREPLSTLK